MSKVFTELMHGCIFTCSARKKSGKRNRLFFFQKYACGIKESAEVTPLCCACYVGTLKHLWANAIIFSIHSVLVFLKKEDAGLMWKLHFSSSWECSEFDVNYLFRSLQSAILQLFSKSFLAYLLKHEVFKAELFAVWFSVKLCLMRWLGTEMPQFQPRWCHTWW